jgi:hypothetical protein
MPKRKTSKVFVKRGDSLSTLLWADMSDKDGSVMLGIPAKGSGGILHVSDTDVQYPSHELITEESKGHEKISFHVSGQYKLLSKVGKTEDTLDRATVEGVRLSEIQEPV